MKQLSKTAQRLVPVLGLTVFCLLIHALPAHAFNLLNNQVGSNLTDVSKNVIKSTNKLPGLVSALSYLIALLFGVMGVLKLKEHVEAPNQVKLRDPLIRFIAGGVLLSLPTIYKAMQNMYGHGSGFDESAGFSIMDMTGGLVTDFSKLGLSPNLNGIFASILTSVGGWPGFVSGISYLLALVFGVAGVLKIREHVDSPENVPLREGVSRFVGGGALLSLPVIFTAFRTAIAGDKTSVGDVITSILTGVGDILPGLVSGGGCSASSLAGGAAGPLGGLATSLVTTALNNAAPAGPTVGDVICTSMFSAIALPHFLIALSYLFGIFLGVWSILKFKDNIMDPRQHSIWEGVSRMLAAGCFFALPYLIGVAEDTIGLIMPFFTTGFGDGAAKGSAGLDVMMVKFVGNIYGPMLLFMNFFGYCAGTILLMVAISRLMKGAQEGPRGPGGMGTIMTFLAAGALISLSPMISSFTVTLFSGGLVGGFGTNTTAVIGYLTTDDQAHILPVLEAVLQFMIVLGLISFARGIFIIRDVAEGHGQASVMSGMTHLIGGALAINLGPLMNAVQSTLGLDPATSGVIFN